MTAIIITAIICGTVIIMGWLANRKPACAGPPGPPGPQGAQGIKGDTGTCYTPDVNERGGLRRIA